MEDHGVNHAGLQIFEVDKIIDERGEGVLKEYLAYWKPRSQWPEPSWWCHTNFNAAAIKAWNESKK